MRLFDEIPRLADDRILLRELTAEDAPALSEIAGDPEIYRYLPTFLYEQKYPDAKTVIARMREECFEPKESIFLGVCLRTDPSRVVGLAEIYNYEPEKEKASIGYRLNRAYWGQGIASAAVALLRDYLTGRTDVRKITAHVMVENEASAKVLERNGFELKWTGLREDWGKGVPVTINKFRYKKEKANNETI